MDIKINTKLNNALEEINVVIETPTIDEQVNEIIKRINNTKNTIVVKKQEKVYIVKIKEIASFYSLGKNIFVKIDGSEYETSYRLYELEGILPKDTFVRISHSCIINKEKIEYFDTSITGEILVKMKDGTKEYVSKRRIKDIKRIIKGGK